MIGVIASPADESVVAEFFELFKTPWEFHRADRRYEVVVCAENGKADGVRAKLLLVYAGEETPPDAQHKVQIGSRRQGAILSFDGRTFPVYGATVTFKSQSTARLTEHKSGEPAAYVHRSGETQVVRIGYDLFREVDTLLKGQPPENAGFPTLELHIEFLRNQITGCGIPLVEIPPVPEGAEFIACLTHDVDHAAIRRYKFDATMFGFLYRATLGSAIKAARGRMSAAKLFANWVAAAKLPLIHLGLARDFWYEFDRYLEIENGRPSTFFLVPFAGRPGRLVQGPAPKNRGTGYDVSHIPEKINRLKAAGCEIALHGIDAWIDPARGREEADRISKVSSTAKLGVRMHWLYNDENSPAILEEAGFLYDSTVGYNETVGYRVGTSQVFKPLRATNLLELPMLVMDTALFYPSRLNLSEAQAWRRMESLFENARLYGGTLTVNWHERSIAPERLWGDFYVRVLGSLTSAGAWFCTAAQAVNWFRKRRSAKFESAAVNDGVRICTGVSADTGDGLPPLRLRSHPAGKGRHVDRPFDGSIDVLFSNREVLIPNS